MQLHTSQYAGQHNKATQNDMLNDFSYYFTNRELKADTKISTTGIHQNVIRFLIQTMCQRRKTNLQTFFSWIWQKYFIRRPGRVGSIQGTNQKVKNLENMILYKILQIFFKRICSGVLMLLITHSIHIHSFIPLRREGKKGK